MDKNNSIKFNYIDSRFTPDDSAKGLFMFLIVQTVVTLGYQVLYMMGFVQSFWSYVFTVIIDAGFVGCVMAISSSKKIDFFNNIKVKKKPTLKQIFICIGISLICLFGFSALTNIFLEVLYRAGYSSVTSDIVIPNFLSYLFYVVMICVIPAVCEEVLFRGLICNGLKKMGTTTAVLLSSFLFMIMHGSPDQTVHQFILGVILALAFLISNNLWVPIIIHFFNNFIAVSLSYFVYGDSANTSAETATQLFLPDYIVYALISAGVASILLYFLFKALSSSKKAERENVEPVEARNTVFQQMPNINSEDNSVINMQGFAEFANGADLEQASLMGSETVKVDEKKFSSTGRILLIISIVWLAFDWISALMMGFNSIY